MRVLLVICAAGLIVTLFTPIWSIDLSAPQYPEGLTLYIHAGKLAGDVEIINGLNHYIGMKTLHANDFIEFTVLPYILIFFAVLYLITAVTGKRKILYTVTILFILFCIIAMVDFWRWEYNYGHNLDENAAIKVPGMAYQPPLLGFKELLNFGAYSFPSIGGFIIFFVALISVACYFLEFKRARKIKLGKNTGTVAMILLLCISLTSCSAKPEPIVAGKDQCVDCKMTISDVKFSAEIISKKGKIYKFDDVHCLLSFMKKKELDTTDVKGYYFTDFNNPKELLHLNEAIFFKSDDFKSPMSGNTAAFSNENAVTQIQEHFKGEKIKWPGVGN